MGTYFINSDARSNSGMSFHNEWLRRGIAVTSGESTYRDDLSKIAFGDRLLLYVSLVGVVAVGLVVDEETVDVSGARMVSPTEKVEYHRQVKWSSDIKDNPVTLDELKREMFIPLSAVSPIKEDNAKLPSFLAFLAARSSSGRRVRFTPDLARQVLRKLKRICDIDEIPERERSQQFHFAQPSARTLLLSQDLHEGWVRVYINRQSRAQEWFPVTFAEALPGVELAYRYRKGFRAANGKPGIAGSAARTPTLNPMNTDVLMLHVNDEAGFTELVNWYAGRKRLGPGSPPSNNEVTGAGPWQDVAPTVVLSPATAAETSVGSRAVPTAPSDGTGAPTLDAPAEADSNGSRSGQGYLDDAAKRSAVEQRAVDLAWAHYEKLRYTVEPRGKPFDLLCTKAGEVVHVEVKGSLGLATSVRLTRNEVADARGPGWRSDLFVVSGINVASSSDGKWIGTGGQQRVFVDWHPRDEDLLPTEFEYQLPS